MSDIIKDEEMTVEVVTFQDDDGNEFDMEIVEEFEHNGRKFAVLAEIEDDCCCEEEGCEHEHEHECGCGCGCEGEEEGESLYIFEIVNGENGEEFVAIEDDSLLDELSAVVEDMLFSEE